MSNPTDQILDVVVVGAGAAGLAAAREAERRGLSCQVIEASDRLGGRVHTVTLPDGTPADLGAQLVNADMVRVASLLREVGGAPLPLPRGGAAVLRTGGVREEVAADPDLLDNLGDLAGIAARLPEGEDISLAALLEQLVADPSERAVLAASMAEMASREPEELSTSGMLRLLGTYASRRSDAEFQLPRGFGPLLDGIAAALARRPLLGLPVTRIAPQGGALGLWSGEARPVLRARGVVLAVPPAAAARIALPAPLAGTRALFGAFASGRMVKLLVRYGAPFWRARGLGGGGLSLAPERFSVVDTSRGDGEPARLSLFAGGRQAASWAAMTPAARRAAAVSALVAMFGEEAAAPLDVTEGVWVDHPWSGGGYNAQIRIGADPEAADRIRAVSGPIVFAGSEYADRFSGFVEGALHDGTAAIGRLALDGRSASGALPYPAATPASRAFRSRSP